MAVISSVGWSDRRDGGKRSAQIPTIRPWPPPAPKDRRPPTALSPGSPGDWRRSGTEPHSPSSADIAPIALPVRWHLRTDRLVFFSTGPSVGVQDA